MATAMSWTSWLASTSPPSTSQVLRILPRSGRIAWNSLSRACLALPPAESPSTRNSSARIGSWPAQSASLPGSAGPWVMRLRSTFLPALRRRPALLMASSASCRPSSVWALSHRLKASLTTPETKAAASRRGQALLGLAGELRLLHLHRQHEGDAVPDVLRRQLDAARQQAAELAELAHGVEQALAQAVDVGAALGGGDQVDVAFLHALAAFGQPQQRPVDRLLVAGQGAAERRRRAGGRSR